MRHRPGEGAREFRVRVEAGADCGAAERELPDPRKDAVQALDREIAQTKLVDLNTDSIESAMRTVEGTARSMGIDVV